jgi:AAA ATPase domain
MTCTAMAVQQTAGETPGGTSTGLSDLVGQRLVTPPIRGRADELKVIGALVAAVAKGRGGVLVIEGPPGIGKSRLLTEVLTLADKCRVRTLFGEAFEYQQAVPFFSLFMATLRAEPPVGDAEALRRLGKLGEPALLPRLAVADPALGGTNRAVVFDEPVDQRSFWTGAWRRRECEADANLAARRGRRAAVRGRALCTPNRREIWIRRKERRKM